MTYIHETNTDNPIDFPPSFYENLSKKFDREAWIAFRYANAFIWKTLDGRLIPIAEMETEHLFNAICMLEDAKHDYSDCPVYLNMITEITRRNK